MKLRNKLLLPTLLMLVLPLAGWRLVQELEQFLRVGQEKTLAAKVETVALALPARYRLDLQTQNFGGIQLLDLPRRIFIDGYADDWPADMLGYQYSSSDGKLQLTLRGGIQEQQLYLLIHVLATETEDLDTAVELFIRDPRGLVHFTVQSAAPGPINISNRGPEGGQLDGYWLDRPDGYQLELVTAVDTLSSDISLSAVQRQSHSPAVLRSAGTLVDEAPEKWLPMLATSPELRHWLLTLVPQGTRAWISNRAGWVAADSGPPEDSAQQQANWVQRLLYRIIAAEDVPQRRDRGDYLGRLEQQSLDSVMQGEPAQFWQQDRDSAQLWNIAAAPIRLDEDVVGAVLMEQSSDGLLLLTNRALARIFFISLLLTLLLGLGLFWFASRLSSRVRRLNAAVAQAMQDPAAEVALPEVADKDELGELARNNTRLLHAVRDYTVYLRSLASKLSHELQTPLAITRSSLENLALEMPDAENRYLQRAQEGVNRQTAIVRAMSEASRLEAAIQVLDTEHFDLAEIVAECVAGYREIHRERRIDLHSEPGSYGMHGAPELIAQLLDKLVGNAVSFTTKQDTISVSVGRLQQVLRLTVRNTGSELPESMRGQLFDSLVSVRKRKEDEAAHLGLGLYLVKLIAEAHGGRVAAENYSADRGAGEKISGVEFIVEFPHVAV